jgi:hypothetical protein
MPPRKKPLLYVYVDGGEYRDGKDRLYRIVGTRKNRRFLRARQEDLTRDWKAGKCRAAERIDKWTR